MSAGGSGESGSVQVVVNALLVCVCVECQSSHKQCSRSVEGSGCCLGPSLLVTKGYGINLQHYPTSAFVPYKNTQL